MTNSMKDLLLGLGFKPPVPPARTERPDAHRTQPSQGQPRRDASRDASRRPAHRPEAPRPQGAPPHGTNARRPAPQRAREEIDLAKAYAIRAQKEKDERIEAERLKQEAARIKREAKAAAAALLEGKALNAADAELTRHFDYNGKIRRVHVSEEQLKSLNAGVLGVVQLDGRYLVVDAALARAVGDLLPSLVALLVDPDAPPTDDPYADPRYQVPDDLAW